MSEGNKKSGGNFRPQSAVTIGRNKRLKGERHQRRMQAQAMKYDSSFEDDYSPLKVARGTARNLRRKPLQVAYAKRVEKAAQAV